MFYEVIPTKIFRNSSGTLTYASDLDLKPGHIVIIPLGKSSCVGIVLKKVTEPSFRCKPITKLLYETPLPPHLLQSALWLSSYYLSPLPACASLLLPVGVGKHRRSSNSENLKPSFPHNKENPQIFRDDLKGERSMAGATRSASRASLSVVVPSKTARSEATTKNMTGFSRVQKNGFKEPPLNDFQEKALHDLQSVKNSTKLLYGITGSGKTNIYLKLTAETLEAQKSVILLVPEIALTSQLVQVFTKTFDSNITLLHSRQTEAERHLAWESILNSNAPQIIIGPRSALFAPVHDLGLIIIDEAHEATYYQENSPKYSALRLASFIASAKKITCLLGSATPLVSDYYLANQKKSLVALTERAKQTAFTPDIKIINSTSRDSFTKNRYFSNALLTTIESNLTRGYQTLIYHNRRGSAPLTLCENCGWQALCPTCFLPLTLHSDSYMLICHTCGHTEPIPKSCPDCHHPSILHKGFGTKLLESELKKLFPEVKIARFDADNKKSDSLDALYDEVKRGDIQILIGTQTVSRGLDLPRLASVGIVQADAGLSLPDFSAEEKTFELLTQVIGRVGRGHLDTASVIIQTYQPDSPIINFAINSDYLGFSTYLLKKRRAQHFPPFAYIAKAVVTYKTEQTTLRRVRTLAKSLNNFITQRHLASVKIFPPTPCFHEHTTSGYSWQLILKSSKRNDLITLLQNVKDDCKIWLDPPSLL